MEYTKEEIKTALLLLSEYEGNSLPINFEDYLKSKLKPETKKIRVEIEYEVGIKLYGEDISAKTLEIYLTSTNSRIMLGQVKVTELPEVFSRDELYIIFKNTIHPNSIKHCLDKFISERDSK